MTARISLTAFPLAILFLLPCSAPAGEVPGWDDVATGPHEVGFRLLEEIDRSRSVRTGAAPEAVRPRPVRVYLWYPAKVKAESTPMTFSRYAALADADVWPVETLPAAREKTAYARRPFARSLGEEGYGEFLTLSVGAHENVAAEKGPFPLIIVGQGLYFESPVTHAALCEYLASHGHVVATTPLVGTHSPLVNLDVLDLETQVRDLEFVIARARELPFVSPEKLGLFGFDMGGMACVILAMRNPDVDAFASVDAGILFGHPSGIPVSSPHHDPTLLRAPWLHATQARFAQAPPDHDGIALFDDAIHSERYLIPVDGVGHADFTSYALVEDRQGMPAYWHPPQEGEKRRYEAVVRYVHQFFRGYLMDDGEARSFLKKDPEESFPGLGLGLEHRPAKPARPVYADFLNALLSGDVAAAMERARSIRQHRPDSPLHDESVLNRLGYHLLFSWEMHDEAIAVFRVNTEIHPESWNAWDSLAEAHWRDGNLEAALRYVRKVLEIDPDNERALRISKELETALEEKD